jgi:hypothetical protein
MIITRELSIKLFNEWNEKAFDNKLPTPSFEIMTTKSILGQFRWRKIGRDEIGYTIRMSNYFDRPYKDFVDTMVHEMLHYYIRYNNIKDTSSHGREWKTLAAEFNRKYGLDIHRTSKARKISENVIEKKKLSKVKHEYVLACELNCNRGRYSACVLPVDRIDYYIKRFNAWKLVKNFKVVLAPWNETFDLRHLRKACGVRGIEKDRFNKFMSYKDIREKK